MKKNVVTAFFAVVLVLAAPVWSQEQAGLSLEQVAELGHAVAEDGQVWLRDASGSKRLVAAVRGDSVVVRVGDGECVLAWDVARLPEIPDLAAFRRRLAEVDHAATSSCVLRFDPLLGPVLHGDGVYVDEGTSWRSTAVDAPELEARSAAVRRAAVELAGAAPRLLPSPASNALAEMLLVLATAPAEQPEAAGEADDENPVTSELVVRWVRHGLLQNGLGDAARALEKAVQEAAEFHVTRRDVDGASGVRETLRNAFGVELHRLVVGGEVRLAVRAARAQYAAVMATFPADGWLVYDLAPGSSGPDLQLDRIRRALFVERGRAVACWTPKAFTVASAAWHAEVAASTEEVRSLLAGTIECLQEHLPPHMTLVDAWGDVMGLATPQGLLQPPRDGSRAEAQRFLRDAAVQLLTPGYLDLLGEYLVSYVPDGPDAERLWVPGSPALTGDLHQTASQTLATVLGGVARGDCDDLAEIYVDLLRRQGRIAHVLASPEHASALTVEQRDGSVRAFVLQSGNPLEFVGDDVEGVLASVVTQLDDRGILDVRLLPVLERFEDENLRQASIVDPRAFVDSEHAARLRRVDEAAQAGLFVSAIRLLATGDGPSTPLLTTRRSQLLAGCGRFEEALALQLQLRDSSRGRAERFRTDVAALGIAAADEKLLSRCEALVGELLGQLPRLGQGVLRRMTATLEVVGALEDSSQIALVLPVVERLCADARMAMNELRRRSHGGGGLSELFAGELADVEEDLLRDLLLQQVLSIVMVLEAPEVAPWTGREKALKVADRWVDEFALRGVVAAESREMHLALLGLCRMLKLGQDETLAAIASVSPPDATAVLDGPPADDETLLRWLRTSRLFHGLLLGTFVDQTRAELDLGRWRECHGMFVAACELATQRGADDRMSPLLAALSTVIDPLLGGDVAALERGVAAAIARDDRNLFEALMEFVAATSRFVNEERWRSFVGVWAKVATRRNAWFPLAWRVARIGSGEHAVAVAEAAVMKFPKDAEMAAELVSLREFVGKAKSR